MVGVETMWITAYCSDVIEETYLKDWHLLQCERATYLRMQGARTLWTWVERYQRYEIVLAYWLGSFKRSCVRARACVCVRAYARVERWMAKVWPGRGRHWQYPKKD